jgi:hypothetical protein
VVETIRLESGHTLTGIGGSNPSLSARPLFLLFTVRDYQLTTKFQSFASSAVLDTGGNMAVTLYRQVGNGKARRYQKLNLGCGRRPTNLTGPYFLRYSLAYKRFIRKEQVVP